MTLAMSGLVVWLATSMPPGSTCSHWKVGPSQEQQDGGVRTSNTCICAETYTGPRCLVCSETQTPREDGGVYTTPRCDSFEQESGCTAGPGALAPLGILVSLLAARRRAGTRR